MRLDFFATGYTLFPMSGDWGRFGEEVVFVVANTGLSERCSSCFETNVMRLRGSSVTRTTAEMLSADQTLG
jgi:hypothetical protein